jgi:hypothetical protein
MTWGAHRGGFIMYRPTMGALLNTFIPKSSTKSKLKILWKGKKNWSHTLGIVGKPSIFVIFRPKVVQGI